MDVVTDRWPILVLVLVLARAHFLSLSRLLRGMTRMIHVYL